VEIEEQLELLRTEVQLVEAVGLMIVQLEEQIVQVQLGHLHLVAEQLDLQQEVQEVLQRQAEATDQLDLITLAEALLEEVQHQVEVLAEAIIRQVEVLLEVVTHQVEALAEVVVPLQVEALLAAEVALAEVLLEETNKKFDFKLFFQNQLLSLTL